MNRVRENDSIATWSSTQDSVLTLSRQFAQLSHMGLPYAMILVEVISLLTTYLRAKSQQLVSKVAMTTILVIYLKSLCSTQEEMRIALSII